MVAAVTVEYRYILRRRSGEDITHPDGRVMQWPSYTAALRGRAMVDCTAHIIQQERASAEEPTCSK